MVKSFVKSVYKFMEYIRTPILIYECAYIPLEIDRVITNESETATQISTKQ